MFRLSFSGLPWSSLGLSGPLWVYMQLHGMGGFGLMRCKPQPPTGYKVIHSTSKGHSLCNVSVCFLWVCGGCLGDWPQKATEAERGTGRPMDKHSEQPPKRPTHTHKKHTETSHKLPTNLPSNRHTPIKTHTDTFHKLPTNLRSIYLRSI